MNIKSNLWMIDKIIELLSSARPLTLSPVRSSGKSMELTLKLLLHQSKPAKKATRANLINVAKKNNQTQQKETTKNKASRVMHM